MAEPDNQKSLGGIPSKPTALPSSNPFNSFDIVSWFTNGILKEVFASVLQFINS